MEHLPCCCAAAVNHCSLHCSRWASSWLPHFTHCLFWNDKWSYMPRECSLCPVRHWLLLVVSQVAWLQSSTQMLLKLLSCWPGHSPSWSSVSNNATSHRALITTLYRLTLPSLCWGFVEVGGWNALMEGYGNAIPSVRVPNSTCGIPRDDAFHIFRDPVSSDLPWPGTLIGMSIPSMWYWCSDQVQAWKVCVTQTSQSKHSIQLWFRLKFKLDILLVAW